MSAEHTKFGPAAPSKKAYSDNAACYERPKQIHDPSCNILRGKAGSVERHIIFPMLTNSAITMERDKRCCTATYVYRVYQSVFFKWLIAQSVYEVEGDLVRSR